MSERLARAYEKRFRDAGSDIHRGWLSFFEKSLEKQVRAVVSEPTKIDVAQERYVSVWHAAVSAQDLLTKAMDRERKCLLEDLRKRRRIFPDSSSVEHWLLDVRSDAIFHCILSFL